MIPHPYRRKGGAAWLGVSEPGTPGPFGVRPEPGADPADHATGPTPVVLHGDVADRGGQSGTVPEVAPASGHGPVSVYMVEDEVVRGFDADELALAPGS